MNYIFTKEQYLSAKAAWNNMKDRTPEDHIIYNVIRGFDLKRGFTEITNPTKLCNGAKPWDGFNVALRAARYKFSGPRIWPAVQERHNLDYEAKMKDLGKRYGVTFTVELMEAVREVLK